MYRRGRRRMLAGAVRLFGSCSPGTGWSRTTARILPLGSRAPESRILTPFYLFINSVASPPIWGLVGSGYKGARPDRRLWDGVYSARYINTQHNTLNLVSTKVSRLLLFLYLPTEVRILMHVLSIDLSLTS